LAIYSTAEKSIRRHLIIGRPSRFSLRKEQIHGTVFGRGLFTYPQIATVMGNPEVAERLEEVAMEKPEDEETDVSSSC
jgi:hypothetical protein